MWLNVLLICATPFVVGAVILWIAERRQTAWGNDPLAFLRHAGFAPPVQTWIGHELRCQYSKDDVDVITTWDGAPTVRVEIRAGTRHTKLGDLSLDELAALLRGHPELLEGDV